MSILLKEDALISIEVQYLPELINNCYIDMIYHKLGTRNSVNFSTKHKNWIINNGCSGNDVKNLILNAQEILYRENSIKLKEEVDII